MKCNDVQDYLYDTSTDQLNEQHADLTAHIANCDSCNLVANNLNIVREAFVTLSTPSLSASFDQSLAQRLKATPIKKRSPITAVMAIAASLLVVVFMLNTTYTQEPTETRDFTIEMQNLGANQITNGLFIKYTSTDHILATHIPGVKVNPK